MSTDAETVVRGLDAGEVTRQAVAEECAWYVNCLEYTYIEGAVWVRPDSDTSNLTALLSYT